MALYVDIHSVMRLYGRLSVSPNRRVTTQPDDAMDVDCDAMDVDCDAVRRRGGGGRPSAVVPRWVSVLHWRVGGAIG